MKIKSIFILLATLLIGFAIGFLVNGQITRQKFERFVSQNHQEAFRFRIMKVIRPDEAQTRDIDPILQEYARKAQETMQKSKEDLTDLHENLITDLTPYLNQQQLERLEQAHRRFDRTMRERYRHGHPPPHRERGRPGNR
jgi:hypothetical protein